MAWCPHCQHDLDLMTEVQEQCHEESVKFVLINCAKILNLDLCFDELINGVPTINVFIDGKRTVKNYQGTTVKKFNDMITAHLGGPSVVKEWKAAMKARKESDEDNF
jgi:thiol-disulfide isomerase/thioredoxin